MFEDLQINSQNFRGVTGSEVKPALHKNARRQENKQLGTPYSAAKGQGHHQNGNGKSGAKSEANSHKSDYSGLISKSNGGSGSQNTQTTAHSNTESSSDDHQTSLLISKLQKLPANAPWSDKQEILTGKIQKLATTQKGSLYLQTNLLTKSNPVLIEFLLCEVGQGLSKIMVNTYGNYFFQKLLSNCSVDQRMRIL